MIFAIKTIICIAVIGPITAWAIILNIDNSKQVSQTQILSSGLCQKKTACSAI